MDWGCLEARFGRSRGSYWLVWQRTGRWITGSLIRAGLGNWKAVSGQPARQAIGGGARTWCATCQHSQCGGAHWPRVVQAWWKGQSVSQMGLISDSRRYLSTDSGTQQLRGTCTRAHRGRDTLAHGAVSHSVNDGYRYCERETAQKGIRRIKKARVK